MSTDHRALAGDDELERALTGAADPPLRHLPADAAALLRDLAAPPRLGAHLRIVHHAAWEVTEALGGGVEPAFDRSAVLFGAATHDIGKVRHPGELLGPGARHEEAGYRLLREQGVEERLARFARTHAAWRTEPVELEDLLVSLADKVWKGKREADLEESLAARLAERAGGQAWEWFLRLDDAVAPVAAAADTRLAYQSGHAAR
ncbi:HD domain-containing protein [Streptomonospora sp. S1-112]|uniref:HD domain-containing protein n=1 Tax=Streptomonospora mangrovi TaxID=2883123 RepID=A0A9X3NQ51_9ACTN|nr:HD domain-containing protein [Streptomonospora mangrovi]MDA0566268.1 HD domain-containing protein [Streptomonospora mangrovi]